MHQEFKEALKCSGCKMEMLRLWQSGVIKIEDMQSIFEACTIKKSVARKSTGGGFYLMDSIKKSIDKNNILNNDVLF